MRHQVRTKFDPSRDFTARRRMTVSGVPCEPGEPFDKSLLTERRLRVFFETRRIVYLDGPVGGAKMTEEQAAETHRGGHAARAKQNTARHAAHFAAMDKKRSAEKAKGEDAPAPRKRNSPEKIKGLKDAKPVPAAPKAKADKKPKAPAPKTADKAATGPIDTKGEEFKARMAAARAAAAARRAATEAAAAPQEPPAAPSQSAAESAAPPPPPAAPEAADKEEAKDAPKPKALKPLKKAETVKDEGAISAARAAVVIPEDWATLEWNALSSLAAQLSDEPIRSKAVALQVISAEVDRRGSA